MREKLMKLKTKYRRVITTIRFYSLIRFIVRFFSALRGGLKVLQYWRIPKCSALGFFFSFYVHHSGRFPRRVPAVFLQTFSFHRSSERARQADVKERRIGVLDRWSCSEVSVRDEVSHTWPMRYGGAEPSQTTNRPSLHPLPADVILFDCILY